MIYEIFLLFLHEFCPFSGQNLVPDKRLILAPENRTKEYTKFFARHKAASDYYPRQSDFKKVLAYQAFSYLIRQHPTYYLVPGAGVEPASPRGRGILSPLRIPVSPPGHASFVPVQQKEDKENLGLPSCKKNTLPRPFRILLPRGTGASILKQTSVFQEQS